MCWAHLKRNWEKMLERGGKAKVIAESCLRVQQRVFEHWHLFRGGGCSRSQLDDDMAPLMLELLDVLHAGQRCRDRKTKRFCAVCWMSTLPCGRLWSSKASSRRTTMRSVPNVARCCGVGVPLAATVPPAAASWSVF